MDEVNIIWNAALKSNHFLNNSIDYWLLSIELNLMWNRKFRFKGWNKSVSDEKMAQGWNSSRRVVGGLSFVSDLATQDREVEETVASVTVVEL